MRQRLLAHALHTDGGAGGGGDGGGQARAATAEERAAAVVQIEAELAAWERLALPLPPPRWAEPTATGRPPLAQEPTAAAAPLASAASASSAAASAAAASAAADAAMASSPARAAPVATAPASSAGTAAAAADVISQMRVEQRGQGAVLGGATAPRPPGMHGSGPWLLHAFTRRTFAAQAPVGSSHGGGKPVPHSPISPLGHPGGAAARAARGPPPDLSAARALPRAAGRARALGGGQPRGTPGAARHAARRCHHHRRRRRRLRRHSAAAEHGAHHRGASTY